MSRHISSVLEINPGLKRSWTVLVQVVEVSHVQKSQRGYVYKRLMLTDSDGTTLTALMYENSFRYFVCSLVQYKRYHISNANVSVNNPRFRISEYEYYWTLNNRTLVEEFVEPIPMTLPSQFDFTMFDQLPSYVDLEASINIKAIVLHCFPSRHAGSDNSTRRDIVVVNEEKKLLRLTLWNLFDTHEGKTLETLIESRPVIFGMRLKVTTFNSLSLTTRLSSSLLINPPSIVSLDLKDWYTANNEELQQLLDLKSYKNTDFLLPYPKDEEIIPISKAASSMNTLKTAWVKGKTFFSNQDRFSWYTACKNCQKSLDADVNWVVACPSCKQQSQVEARSRITFLIEDDTSSIRATICTPEVEKIIPFTATQLKEAVDNEVDLRKDIANSIQENIIVAFLRSYEATYLGQAQLNISVAKCYKYGDVIPTPNLVSIRTTGKTSESTVDIVHLAGIEKVKEQVLSPSTPSKTIKRSLPIAAKIPVSTKASYETSTSI